MEYPVPDPLDVEQLFIKDRAGQRTITVPGDYSTIQDALDSIEVFPPKVVIDVSNGTYNEDLVIRNVVGSSKDHPVIIHIQGDTATPSNVEINSVYCAGVPTWVRLDGVKLLQNNPYDDENTPLSIYDTSHFALTNSTYGGGGVGVVAYGNTVLNLATVDFGATVLSDDAIRVKHGAYAFEQQAVSTPTSGNVGGHAYEARPGFIEFIGDKSTLTGNDGLVNMVGNGRVRNVSSGGAIRKYDTAGNDLWRHIAGAERIGFGGPWIFPDAELEERNNIRISRTGYGLSIENAEDLSGKTGDYDGQIRMDDGTNTAHRMVPCVWDDVNAVWVDVTDGTTFT